MSAQSAKSKGSASIEVAPFAFLRFAASRATRPALRVPRPGLSFIHDLVGTKLATHGARAMLFINPRFGTQAPGSLGVYGEGELPFPVKRFAAFRHGDVFFDCTGDALDDVAGMGGDAAGHDPFVDIFHGRQAQMFAGGDVTEEVGTRGSSQGAADSTGDMVVAGSDIGH